LNSLPPTQAQRRLLRKTHALNDAASFGQNPSSPQLRS
jgi:hypothetical protein